MPARGRARREPSKMLNFTTGLSVFAIFKHGRTRLGTEGGETIVTYAKNVPLQKQGKRRDHSHILPLGCLLGASWGCLGGLLEAWLQGGLLEASWGPLGRPWGNFPRPLKRLGFLSPEGYFC